MTQTLDAPTAAAVAERALIGKLFAGQPSTAEIEAAMEGVRETDFSDPRHRLIWTCARTGWAAYREIDIGRTHMRCVELDPKHAAPSGWWNETLDCALVGLPLVEAATIVARAGAERDLEAARRDAALAFEPDAAGDAMAHAVGALIACQARRDLLLSGIMLRPVAARDLAALLETEDPAPPEELVERLITRPGVVIAYGASGSGKSYALMAACLDLIGGGGCFCGAEGLQLRPRTTRFGDQPDRVLWIYGSEDPERRIRHRARELWASGPHAGQPIPPGQFMVASPGSMCLGTPEGLRWLRREIESAQATVVILDTVQSLTSSSLDTSDGGQVARWMVSLHAIRDATQAVIVPVCHTSKTPTDAKSARGKADSLLGSQAWRALADGMVMIDAPDGDASAGTLRLIKGKDVDSPIPPLRIGMDGATKRFRPIEDETDGERGQDAPQGRTDARIGRPKSVTVDAVLALRKRHPDGLPWSDAGEMQRLLGVSRTPWFRERRDLQAALLAAGHVVVQGRLVWAEATTPKEPSCRPEKSTSLQFAPPSTMPGTTSPTSSSPSGSTSSQAPSPTPSISPSGSVSDSASSRAADDAPRSSPSADTAPIQSGESGPRKSPETVPECVPKLNNGTTQDPQSRNPWGVPRNNVGPPKGYFGTGVGRPGAEEAEGNTDGVSGLDTEARASGAVEDEFPVEGCDAAAGSGEFEDEF